MISNGFSTSKLNNIYLLFSPSSKSEPWHQVDFMSAQNLSGILTQGSPSSDKWVSTFTVATSNDGINFDPVHDQQGKPIVYMSNMDRNTIARNFFPKVIVARFVRLFPVTWASGGAALRLNYIGCNLADKPTERPTVPFFQPPTGDFVVPTAPITSTTASTSPSAGPSSGTTPTVTGTSVIPTVSPPPFPIEVPNVICNVPMNVDVPGLVKNTQLTASSDSGSGRLASDGRLNIPVTSWQPDSSDAAPWHQVDFLTPKNLSGVLTQGSPSSDKWVSSFTIGTSNDGINFNVITDPQNQPIVYMSNQDRNTIARNYFPKVIVARYVRLYPQNYTQEGAAIRLNYIGCNLDDKTVNRPTIPFFQPLTGAFITPPAPGSTGSTTPIGGTTVSSTVAPPTPFYVVPSE